jgi:predicted dehydrogenase
MQEIRWGIIGAGAIAAKFASDLKTVPNCKIVAISSTSQERANEFASTWEIEKAYGSYESMFETQLDVVYVASRHPFHKEHTLLCLKNNVAILCEKPFGMNAVEVEEMLVEAKAKNIFLMEALWSCFHPSLIKAKELLDEGKIGRAITFQADFGFKGVYDTSNRLYDPEKGGGALLDIGIYPAFFSYAFFGYPSKIQASSIFAPTGTDETTSFIFKYENNLTSVLNCTFASNTNCEAIIYGELGKITIHSRFHEAMKVSLTLNEGETETFDFTRETLGYDYEITHVNDCVRNSITESAIMSHANSRDLIKLLDEIARIAKD